jgi:hypothetical protein
LSGHAQPPDESADDKRFGDDAADAHDDVEDGGNAELVIKLSPVVSESLASLTQRQSEILRQFFEPITSAWAALISKSMLAGIDTSALHDFSETVSASLPRFELPLIDLSALTELQTNLSRLVSGIDFGAFRRALRRGQPPNWEDLGDGVKLSKLLEITDAGLPTAWVPRASVLKELIDADRADRPAVFGDRRSEVIEDCRTVLNDITSPELVDLAELLHEALDAAHDGRLAAAQALSASIFDTALRKTIPQQSARYYAKVKAEIVDRHENASIAEMRWGFVHVRAVVVLNDFWEFRGDTIPTTFNRHASAHAVGRVQYTPANAVVALALATSLVREAHQTIVDEAEEAA